MKIVHVITGMGKAAGTTTFVENIVREQRALGHIVEVCTNQEVAKFLSPPTFSTYSLIHIHGLWSPLLHKASRFARNHHIPVVWSTHGMTAPWSLHHKWWKKCLPWYLYQRPDLRAAALIHCTTDLEAEWNKALGFKNVFVAPLGTTLPKASCAEGTGRARSPSAPHVLLYVGRIYPVKALDNAIRAIALMKCPIKLRIVGPDQAGHMAELMSLCDSLHLPYTKPWENTSAVNLNLQPQPKQVQFIGPKYDADLSAEYDNCDGLVLVSHTENFGATVVDAMAHGRPVITSTKTPWQKVSEIRCGWCVDNDPNVLAATFLDFAVSSETRLMEMGSRGRALVESTYTWPSIAERLVESYEGVCL